MKTTRFPIVALTFAAACLAAFATPTQAQDYGAMVQQSMNRMNQIVRQAEQRAGDAVQQRMQNPQVQQQYQQYVRQMQSQGRPPMNFQTYAYYHVYTNGFSQGGIDHMRNNEAGIRAREMQSVQGLRDAQANRARVMQQQRDSYFHNQQEAGRGLMGQSTYYGYGGQRVLPHTWQNNSWHQYQGQQYHVDEGGRYYVRGNDGYYYPIQR
jgi:hypothetical protein